jgi:SAM-dependent methyltransferase
VRKRRPRLTARTADPRELYEESVQDPGADIRLLARWFEKERGRNPVSLREDFCGTALFCADWIRSDRRRTAIGVDLDPAPMKWGRARHFGPRGADSARMRFVRGDATRVGPPALPRVDLITAFNFSWCVLQERRELLRYFRRARVGLARDGLFALDLHGGPDSLAPAKDEQAMGGFTYVWDQGPLDPITHRTIRRIHFRFPDGSALRDVYRYDWRIWTLPETRDALREAGFRAVDVLWEQFDARGEGNGVFRRVERAVNEDSWVAYLLAWR